MTIAFGDDISAIISFEFVDIIAMSSSEVVRLLVAARTRLLWAKLCFYSSSCTIFKVTSNPTTPASPLRPLSRYPSPLDGCGWIGHGSVNGHGGGVDPTDRVGALPRALVPEPTSAGRAS